MLSGLPLSFDDMNREMNCIPFPMDDGSVR